HDQVEAMTMGHRVAVLNFGELQQVDTPKKLYEEPANAFVAGFIGSPAMNLIRVNGSVEGWDLQLPREEVIVGVRPEALELAEAGVAGTVTMVEELGADSYIYVDTAHGQLVARGGDTRQAPGVGEQVHVAPRSGAQVHYFDAITEQRINEG
ncbi:MAG TPA: TOBE domain-containing protein, partial [Candidatus Corynebacterium gallistercoris]|nr:TOBE domain-containing protein [Candidatus Corynebacterium gallistercoris]